jgi:hypothetical protein
MNWLLSIFWKPVSRQYRIVRRFGGYEPQFSYNAGMVKGIFWYPLSHEGYYLEPDAFTNGNPTEHVTMSKVNARRAILRARAINEDHIRAA